MYCMAIQNQSWLKFYSFNPSTLPPLKKKSSFQNGNQISSAAGKSKEESREATAETRTNEEEGKEIEKKDKA